MFLKPPDAEGGEKSLVGRFIEGGVKFLLLGSMVGIEVFLNA